jgi:alpha-beta hydrolase superfamily lysophospholipase
VTAKALGFETSFFRWMEEQGMSFARLRFSVGETAEETTAYRLKPAGPPRRTVIALHGAGNDALFAWIGLFKQLLLRETEIFTFDLPGHGRHNETRFAPEAAAASLEVAIAGCVGGAPSVPLHAIGVSLGGSVLLRALSDLQDRLTSAAVIVAPLRIELSLPAVLREVGPRTFTLLWREREHYGLTGLIPSFGSFKREIYPLRLAERPPRGMFGYVETLNAALRSMHLEDAAARIRLPVLLVYGSSDRIVPLAQGERLARLIERSKLLRVQRGTHLSTPLEHETTEELLRWVETDR